MKSCSWPASMNLRALAVLLVGTMLSGCFSVPLGMYETELPASATHIPEEVVSVKRFDGVQMTATGSVFAAELHFAARGRFVVKQEPKRVFEVPKMCAIGFCPGYAVPEPSMLSRTKYKPLVMYCLFWTVIDALFIEPFSGYRPDLNVSNLAQFSFLGCCKYNDIANAHVIREVPSDEEEIEVDEYLFDDCLVSVTIGAGVGMSNEVKLPVQKGVALLSTVGTNAGGGGKGIVLPVKFDTLPPVGGEFREVIEKHLLGRTFYLTISQ